MRYTNPLVGSVLVVLAAWSAVYATEYHLYPGDSIAGRLATALPGDILTLHAGTYGRAYISNVHGAPNAWITVRGAPGEARPVIYYDPALPAKNIIDLVTVSYLKFQRIEITGGASGSDGLKFSANTTSHDVILEDLYIHNVGGGGINASGIIELYNLTVRDCEIAYTGGNGEGFYLGKHNVPTNPQVHDSLIERCYVHHMGGNQGDGIELKHGDYRIVIQDNVLYVNRGYPAITIWGTYKNDPAYNNVVRRNFVYGSTDAGIHITGETDVENNIVVNSVSRGIHCRARNNDNKMQYTRIVNNTVYVAGGDALHLINWDLGPGLVLANNAIYQDDLAKSAINAVNGLTAATVLNNVYYGVVSNPSPSGLIAGDVPAAAFLNPSVTLGAMDFYPRAGGGLIDAAHAAYAPADDFSLLTRPFGAAPDVGAYEVHNGAANPGWVLQLGLKDLDAAIIPGDVDRDADVDIFDVIDVVNAFGSVPGDPNWNENADFDHNGIVDVFDVIDTINDFGQTV